MLWWEAEHAKAEKNGQASCVPEMERAHWLNRKTVRGDGKEGMAVVGGLCDLMLNLISQQCGLQAR